MSTPSHLSLFVMVTATTALLSMGCKQETPTVARLGDFHRYPVEHGHVHYLYSGLGRGYEDLYFDQYGTREAKIANWEHIEDQGLRKSATLNLTLGADVYTCQLDRNAGVHFKDAELDSLFHLSAAETPTADAAAKIYLERRAHLIGQDTVMGLRSNVWAVNEAPIKLSIWNGILLKRITMPAGDTVIMTADMVDTTTPADHAAFRIPPSIKIQERPAPGTQPTN